MVLGLSGEGSSRPSSQFVTATTPLSCWSPARGLRGAQALASAPGPLDASTITHFPAVVDCTHGLAHVSAPRQCAPGLARQALGQRPRASADVIPYRHSIGGTLCNSIMLWLGDGPQPIDRPLGRCSVSAAARWKQRRAHPLCCVYSRMSSHARVSEDAFLWRGNVNRSESPNLVLRLLGERVLQWSGRPRV